MIPEPVVSVILPAYQAAETIGQALASVQAQSEERWEAIVADDGSCDDTAGIVGAAAREDRRIRLVRHPDSGNHGRGAARNLALQAAAGRIVAFLDADDALAPSALSVYVEAFSRDPEVGVVYGRAGILGEPAAPLKGEGLAGTPTSLLRQLARFNVLVTSATAVRREALGDQPFPKELPFSQDWACWLEVARRWPFLFVEDVVAGYRINPAGVTQELAARGREGDAERSLLEARVVRRLHERCELAERRAIRAGLSYRAAAALRFAISAARRGRWREAGRWLGAARAAAASPGILLSALTQIAPQQAAIRRRENPSLTIDRWPDAPPAPPPGTPTP